MDDRNTAVLTRPANGAEEFRYKGWFSGLECLVELRKDDARSGIQFRECLIDYTACPNGNCIKKLV